MNMCAVAVKKRGQEEFRPAAIRPRDEEKSEGRPVRQEAHGHVLVCVGAMREGARRAGCPPTTLTCLVCGVG